MNTTVNTCIGLHASVYGYPVLTPVHMYYFFEVRQMHAYILGFSGIDAASEVGRKIIKINVFFGYRCMELSASIYGNLKSIKYI